VGLSRLMSEVGWKEDCGGAISEEKAYGKSALPEQSGKYNRHNGSFSEGSCSEEMIWNASPEDS
jgi:hypothetical protein